MTTEFDSYERSEIRQIAGSVSEENLNNTVTVDETYGGAGEIGAAFNQARADYHSGDAFASRPFKIEPGEYVQTTPLDLTEFVDGTLILHGVKLNAETSGEPVLDTTGSNEIAIYGGRIEGQSENTPTVGLLEARDESGGIAGQHRLYGTHIRGEWTVAAVYNYASEENRYFGMTVNNDIGDAVYHNSDNPAGVSSPHTTIFTGSESNNGFYWIGCTIRSRPGGDIGHCYRVDNAASFHVRGGIAVCDSGAQILFETGTGGCDVAKVDGLRMHAGPDGFAQHNIEVVGGGVLAAPTIVDNRLEASGAVVQLDADTAITNGLTYTGNRYAGGDGENFAGTVANNGGAVEVSRMRTNPLSDPTMTFADLRGQTDLTGENISVTGGNAQSDYTESNVTSSRSFDADAVTVEELADVVGTLIGDIRDDTHID